MAASVGSPTKQALARNKGYSVASIWDRQAQLDEAQLRAVEALATAVTHTPLPAHVADQPAAGAPQQQQQQQQQQQPAPPSSARAPDTSAAGAAAGEAAGYAGALEDAVLHNANAFLKWHSDLEAACASEAEAKYAEYAAELAGRAANVEGVRDKVDATLSLLDDLVALHHAVGAASADMASGCEALLAERAALTEFAGALRTRLGFFDGYEAAAAEFAAAAAADAAGRAPALAPLLGKLDAAVEYAAANPQYADALAYGAKFAQLQARALGLVRARAQAALRGAAAQVSAAIQEAVAAQAAASASGGSGGGGASPSKAAAAAAVARQGSGGLWRSGSGAGAAGAASAAPLLPEGLEVSLLYVRFRAAAEPGLRAALAGIDARAAARPEYARLMDEVRGAYCAARSQLVAPFASARLAALTGGDAAALLRGGAEQLMRTAQLEAQLYEQLLGGGGGGGASQQQQQQQRPPGAHPQQQQQQHPPPAAEALRPLLEPLAGLLYDALRPRFVQLADIDSLADLIDVLEGEVLSEERAGARGAAVLGALRPALDAALADLRQRLAFRAQAFVRSEVGGGGAPAPGDVDYPARLERIAAAEAAAAAKAAAAAAEGGDAGADGGNGEGADGAEAAQGGGGGGGGPDPLERWYLPVRATLLLLSKLHRCLPPGAFAGLAAEAVTTCAASVQAAARAVARASGELDGQLFAVSHLLLLREQVAAFDVDLATTDVDLDFSHMRSHMRRIVTGEVSLFSLGPANAVVQMLGRGGPRVVAASADAKRDLEAALKAACEAFIMTVTKTAIEPMLGFVTKVTAVRAAAGSNPAIARPLREQAFASPERLAEVVARVNEAMAGPVPAAAAKARLYLTNPATRAILFRPIKSNIAEAHGQIAQLLAAEYTPEEAALVPLMAPDALSAALEF